MDSCTSLRTLHVLLANTTHNNWQLLLWLGHDKVNYHTTLDTFHHSFYVLVLLCRDIYNAQLWANCYICWYVPMHLLIKCFSFCFPKTFKYAMLLATIILHDWSVNMCRHTYYIHLIVYRLWVVLYIFMSRITFWTELILIFLFTVWKKEWTSVAPCRSRSQENNLAIRRE